tara:strand:+ start:2617 stop:3129 length:513 start_codon:yes stop_codon:yes gene_type:complete
MKVPAILKNKYVCYALMALASLNVIGYLTVKAWECLALFTLTAYSCYCYCNNVSCSILAALFVANFVFGCGRVKEGFTDAMKGAKEHMEDAVDSASIAQGMCGAEGATASETACKDAGSTCKFVAKKLQGCVDSAGVVVAVKAGDAAWTNETCKDPNTWNEQEEAATCAE